MTITKIMTIFEFKNDKIMIFSSEHEVFTFSWFIKQNEIMIDISYYAPPSRPEGPRRCPDRGNAGRALVFFPQLLWSLYTLGV